MEKVIFYFLAHFYFFEVGFNSLKFCYFVFFSYLSYMMYNIYYDINIT